MAEENQAKFNLKKIYVKDASFESPQSPQIFLAQQTPEVDVQLDITHTTLDENEGYYEVVLALTVTAKHDASNVFLCEVQQGGLFQVTGAGDELPLVLEIACPNVLLPFVRETIDDLVGKGGFPQLLINPVNFEAMYHQKLLAEQKAHQAN